MKIGMRSIVLTTLSLFLGLFFVFIGSIKVSQQVNRDMHREIRKNFIQYAKVFPLAKQLGFKVPPKVLRLTVGWTEVIAGSILVMIPVQRIKNVANIVLLIVTTGAFYTHLMLHDKFERIAPSLVFTFMLSCRLIVYYQVLRRERKFLENSTKNTIPKEPLSEPTSSTTKVKNTKKED